MAVGYTPICFPAVRPLPRFGVIDSKPHEIIVLCLDFLPLFLIYLPYSAPDPLGQAFHVTLHIGYGIITKPAYCVALQAFEYQLHRPRLFAAGQLSDFVFESLNTLLMWAYACLSSCFVQ